MSFFWYISPLHLFSALFPRAENRCVVSLGETCPDLADTPRAQAWGKQHLSQVTVKLRMSCLLCHLCAEFSEYLTMPLPRRCFVTHQHPRGSKFSLASISSPLLSFSSGALPRASHNAALQASGEAGRQHGKPLEKHNLMQMSKARRAFPFLRVCSKAFEGLWAGKGLCSSQSSSCPFQSRMCKSQAEN